MRCSIRRRTRTRWRRPRRSERPTGRPSSRSANYTFAHMDIAGGPWSAWSMSDYAPPILQSRREQMYFLLTDSEIDRLRRFGETRRLAQGEYLIHAGDTGFGMAVILAGQVLVSRRAGLGHDESVSHFGKGNFVAEVGQLSGRASFVDVRAESDTEALVVSPASLRRLMIAEAELGERIMRALILRRVGLIETGAGGPVLIGPQGHPDVVRLQNFLGRNAIPYRVLDPEDAPDAAALLTSVRPAADELPLVIAPDGTVLRNPSEHELGERVGLRRRLVADRELPRVPDRHLRPGAGRARLQPGAQVRGRHRDPRRGAAVRLPLAGRPPARARRRDHAAGQDRGYRQRRPIPAAGLPGACCGRAAKVWMLVRGPSLAASMSRYLIERIEAQPNIELLTRTEVECVEVDGTGSLARIVWRDLASGVAPDRAMRHLFLFIGAAPCTDWLSDCPVGIDAKGFVLTGRAARPTEIDPRGLMTSLDGVFAIGDVRSGSTKRVAAAVGEGAAVVAEIHAYLAQRFPELERQPETVA